jgi:hypothetical protein
MEGTDHRAAISEIHARIGRNVIRVQLLEIGLKTLLPFIDIRGASHCLDGLTDRHGQVAKHTLGQLVEAFLRRVSTDPPGLAAAAQKILNDRNNLIHHFHSTLGTRTSTAEGRAWVMAQLDEQFEAIKLFEQLVSGLLLDVLHALRESTFKDSVGSEDFNALCREFNAALQGAGMSGPVSRDPESAANSCWASR